MQRNGFRLLALAALILSVCVIGLGAYTRLTEAGLGCPDWPGCYGFAGVPKTDVHQELAAARYPHAPLEVHKAWNEMLHRYVAGTLGIMILAINVLAWRRPERPRGLPACLLVTVVFQAMLGMWTVTLSLMPVVVMGHLLGGFTTASLLLVLWLRLRPLPMPRSPSRSQLRPSSPFASSTASAGALSLFALLGLAVVIGQIALGGWTAANYAAVVCTQLPLCEVDWQQSFDSSAFSLIQPVHDSYQYGVLDYQQRVTIHVTHRIGAAVTTLVLLLLAWQLWRHPALRQLALLMLGVLCGQVALGITNVVASLPLGVAVAHNLTGMALLLVLVAVNVQVFWLRRPTRHWQGSAARLH